MNTSFAINSTFLPPNTPVFVSNKPSYSTVWNSSGLGSDQFNLQNPLQTIASQTRLMPDGMVLFPQKLIDTALQHQEKLIPQLETFFHQQQAIQKTNGAHLYQFLPLLAGIYTAERLAEAGTPIDTLYPLLSQWDRHSNPLVAIYLAGAYAEMHRPEPFGWALMKLMETAQNPPQPNQPHVWKLHEELGKLVMKQLKLNPALWQQLQPYLKKNVGQNPLLQGSSPLGGWGLPTPVAQ